MLNHIIQPRIYLHILAVFFLISGLSTQASGNSLSSACSDSADPSRTSSVKGRQFMVAAAHPLAVEAGCKILDDGGTAIDAAVAVQAALTVVEPESSGLAGGSIITYWDKQSRRVRFFEGLSRAPAAVTDGLRTPTEQDELDCGVSSFSSSVEVTGRAFGVPGTVKVLDMVHQRYGGKSWDQLFDTGISLADDGFPMPLYMNTVLGDSTRGLERCQYPDLRARYCDGDTPKAVDTPIVNTELAQVLREVRDGGADAFYDPVGNIAPAIIERITRGQCQPAHEDDSPAVVPSLMTVGDFAAYEARERNPVCGSVFGHTICSSAPPAYGGTAILSMLKLMEQGGIKHMSPNSAEYFHLAIESSRLAQWDRREYVGDPDYNHIPVDGLLDTQYLKSRFALYSPFSAINPIVFGNPPRGVKIGRLNRRHRPHNGNGGWGWGYEHGHDYPYFSDASQAGEDDDMTSHISIVDRYGNALSMTTTNNTTFGSQLEARGIILNNVQTNFTRLDSISPGKPANIMESMKKPRTSTAPTLVFNRRGKLKLVVGAAGGGAIPDYIAQTILGVILHDLDPQTAINVGHFSGQGLTSNCAGVIGARSELEEGTGAAGFEAALDTLGHPCLRSKSLRSGLSAIQLKRRGRVLLGGADIRRDGVAMGL